MTLPRCRRGMFGWSSMGECLQGLVRLGSSNHYGPEEPNSLVGTHHGLEGSLLMYSVTEELQAAESHCTPQEKCPLQLQVSLSGCSPTTAPAPFLTAPTGSHCVIGVAVFGPCCRGTVRPCSALGCEELWPPPAPFCEVLLRSGLMCSCQFHEEDGTRPPPLPGHSFTDRNPFVLIKVSCASVRRTSSGRNCVYREHPLGIRSEKFESRVRTWECTTELVAFRLTSF